MPDWMLSLISQQGWATVTAAIITAIAFMIVTMVTQSVNLVGSISQKKAAALEGDIKITNLFGDLVAQAYGFGATMPMPAAIVERLLKEFDGQVLMGDSIEPIHRLRSRLESATVINGVPFAKQKAAADSIVVLAIKHPIIHEPALSALNEIAKLMRDDRPYKRLLSHRGSWLRRLRRAVGRRPRP